MLFHHVASVIGDVDASSKPAQPEPRMSAGMEAILKRLLKEDAHLPHPMLIPWEQAQANFHLTSARWNKVDEKRFHIAYFSVPCPARQMAAVRLVCRKGNRPGTLLYLHGGGWVFGSLQTHLGAMARLAEYTGLTVIGIDYGLAPQAPFPAGLNDATWAWRWPRSMTRPTLSPRSCQRGLDFSHPFSHLRSPAIDPNHKDTPCRSNSVPC